MVAFAPDLDEEGRTWAINALARKWKKEKRFEEILRGWSNESYPVYHTVSTTENMDAPSPLAFSIERAALPLFGLPNYGCLLIAYFLSPETDKLMLWVPRRSITKRTWPGCLDVTVGGGMGTGESARSTIIRECAEEASLDPAFVQRNLHSVGLLSFPNRSPSGWILPGYYHLFELVLPTDGSVQPRTNVADGEVESFELMDVDTVIENLYSGTFKPSSALAMVQFLIRRGIVTETIEPEFTRVRAEMNRQVYPYYTSPP
ncbi:NUDIX hydrolase domain-like protein [Amylostereum chailletii]|nr:NUDIX hydrolase domain-like protein [Amylostereum chailletii]